MLRLTMNDPADELLNRDPFSLLVGMLLDQQFPMERAFAGPYVLADRLGDASKLDPRVIVETDDDKLLALAKGPPAIHRYPGSMIARIKVLAQVVLDEYDGDAARIWTTAADGPAAYAALRALPGFGDAKARIFLALLGKQLGQAPAGWEAACAPYGETGSTMSIADVTSPESLAAVRAWKQEKKRAAQP